METGLVESGAVKTCWGNFSLQILSLHLKYCSNVLPLPQPPTPTCYITKLGGGGGILEFPCLSVRAFMQNKIGHRVDITISEAGNHGE